MRAFHFPLFIGLMLFGRDAFGQYGLDMVNSEMMSGALFKPHRDNCNDPTYPEAFVPAGEGADANPQKGFCIEKSERTAATWDAARDVCASAGKRLPEPTEFKKSL